MMRWSPSWSLGAVLALGTGSLLLACGSDDETGAGAAAAGTTSTTGQGGAGGGTTTSSANGGGVQGGAGGGSQGGAGGGAHGGAGGGGGATLSSSVVCSDVCTVMVACPDGAGGAGQTLEQCYLLCETAIASCDNGQLYEVLGCMSPNLEPDCDEEAYFACLDAIGCVDNG